jgi:hypothetical protein
MPKLFVVSDQRNLDELAPSLLKGRVSAGVKEAALDAIRRANPSLDPAQIAPGTVVVVPPFKGAKDTAQQDPVAAAADDLVARVRSGLELLISAAGSAEDQRTTERKELQTLLGSAVVKRLSPQVPELAANIETLRSGFKQEDTAARDQQAALHAAVGEWAGDLDVLRGLL